MRLHGNNNIKAAWLYGLLAVSLALPLEPAKKDVKAISADPSIWTGLLPRVDIVDVEPEPVTTGGETGVSTGSTSEGGGATGHLGSGETDPTTEGGATGATTHLGQDTPTTSDNLPAEDIEPFTDDTAASEPADPADTPKDTAPTDESVEDNVAFARDDWKETFQDLYSRRTYSSAMGKFVAGGVTDGGLLDHSFSQATKDWFKQTHGIDVDNDVSTVVRTDASANHFPDVYRSYTYPDKGHIVVTRMFRSKEDTDERYAMVTNPSERLPIFELTNHEFLRTASGNQLDKVTVGSISNTGASGAIKAFITKAVPNSNGIGSAHLDPAQFPDDWAALQKTSAGSFLTNLGEVHGTEPQFKGKMPVSADVISGGVGEDFWITWNYS